MIKVHYAVVCGIFRGVYSYIYTGTTPLAPYPLPVTPRTSGLAVKGFLSCMCRWAGSWKEEEEGAGVGTV